MAGSESAMAAGEGMEAIMEEGKAWERKGRKWKKVSIFAVSVAVLCTIFSLRMTEKDVGLRAARPKFSNPKWNSRERMRRRSPRNLKLYAIDRDPSSSTDLVFRGGGSKYRAIDEEMMKSLGNPTPADFYELLNVDETANVTSLKRAYRQIFKQCHPDRLGAEANDFCELVNVAYDVLTDEDQRPIYDQELQIFRETEGDAFDGLPKSAWGEYANATEERAVFVDELTCIGCRMCSNCAGNTFGMEDTWGRARVKTQWGDSEEEIIDAIDSCPVDCIYWVQRRQLPLLEYIMTICNRLSVAAMMTGQSARDDPFVRAEYFLRERGQASIDGSLNRDTNVIHTGKLQASIARAWLQLPPKVRGQLWPKYKNFNEDDNEENKEKESGSPSA